MTNPKAKIAKKIEILETEIAGFEITLEESEQARQEILQLMKSDNARLNQAMIDEDVEIDALFAKSDLSIKVSELEMLRQTMAAEIAEVTTRFVIIREDESLVSPGGFHPSEKVFVKTEVFIQTDKLPRVLSGCKAYDMDKVA